MELAALPAVFVEDAEPEVEDAVEEPVPLAAIPPVVPLATEPAGRLTVDFAARAWKFASERVAFFLVLGNVRSRNIITSESSYFSLMTMVIPFWQCLP